MTVYIPSYFKDYQERKDKFKEVIDSYLKLDFYIVIYWMNPSNEKILNERIKYIDADEIVNASIARNHLLRLFYASEDDEAILSDDDTILNAFNSFKIDFDVISLVNDKRPEIVETPMISSAIMIVKNLKKKYDKELYFDESLESNQDYDFGLNLVSNGLKVGTLNTQQVEINKGKSVMFDNQMQRLYRKNQTLHTIIKKWKLNDGFSNR